MAVFFRKRKSTLTKILDDYDSLFETWEKESFHDGSVDEISYVKNNIKIVFQEDLREHITNLYMIDFQKQIGKIHYRDIMLDNGLTGVDKLKNALSLLKNNAEKQEIEIYIEFLQTNNII